MKPLARWAWTTAGLLCLAACGVEDRNVGVRDEADASDGTGGEGGTSGGTGGAVGTSGGASSGGTPGGTGGAGTGGTPVDGGSAGAGTGGTSAGGTAGAGGGGAGGVGGSGAGGSATCSPACTDPTPECDNGTCVICLDGRGRCQGSTPQTCTSGAWVSGTTCTGTTPICAQGQCTGTRLVGSIVTTAGTTGGTIRLRSGGLEVQQRVCTQAGNICVTGGIAP